MKNISPCPQEVKTPTKENLEGLSPNHRRMSPFQNLSTLTSNRAKSPGGGSIPIVSCKRNLMEQVLQSKDAIEIINNKPPSKIEIKRTESRSRERPNYNNHDYTNLRTNTYCLMKNARDNKPPLQIIGNGTVLKDENNKSQRRWELPQKSRFGKIPLRVKEN